MKLLTIFIVTCLYWQMADSCPDQGDLPEECLDCRLVRVACTNQLRNAKCRPRCNSQEVCCENCCGGQSCVAKNSGNNDDGSNGDQNDCDFACTDEYRPICGSDGRTYGNGCELRAAMCRNPGLTVQQKGACPPDVPACPDGSDPVNCFVRPCEFATCEANPDAICEDNYCGGCNTDWYVDGELVDCDDGDSCESHICTEEYDPICGSDGQTYGNPCEFKFAKRCDNPALEFDHSGECVCSLPIVLGPCRGSFPRWGYRNGRCEEFIYGGCQGNANSFLTEADCVTACSGQNVCSLPIVLGPCKGSFPRWGYRNGRCEEFIYGGCQGNANNFLTEADCVAACSGQNVCSLPIVLGPCKGSFPRWGYRNGRCEEFIYGGCKGNANSFLTEADCVAACSGQNVCQLPLVTGPCEALIHRWGFRNDECVGFIYGGCEGNANNFESLADCIDACGPK